MARRKSNNLKALTPVLGGTVGFVGGRLLDNVDFVQANPMIGGAGKIIVGMMLSTQRQEILASAGVGMAINGASQIVDTVMPPPGVGYIPNRRPNQVLGTHSQKRKVVVQ